MVSPQDGTPNLRPGVERDAGSIAPRFDPQLALDDLFEDFLADSASLINERTERLYGYDWSHFTAGLDESGLARVLDSITKANAVAYIAWLQRRPKAKGKGTPSSHSVHHYVRVVRTFVRWLVTEGVYPADPFAGGRRGVMPRLGPRLLKVAKRTDLEPVTRETPPSTQRGDRPALQARHQRPGPTASRHPSEARR